MEEDSTASDGDQRQIVGGRISPRNRGREDIDRNQTNANLNENGSASSMPLPFDMSLCCSSENGFVISLVNALMGCGPMGYKAAKRNRIDESVESKSPRDTEGYGTHTASTAAGSIVANVGLFGYAQGEAKGIAIKARIAVYKICWSLGCFDSDILSAFNQVVEDDVHSFWCNGAQRCHLLLRRKFRSRSIHCRERRAVDSKFLTVGASTIDRTFPTDVVLGDGRVFTGMSLYSGELLGDYQLPVDYGGDANNTCFYSGNLTLPKSPGRLCSVSPEAISTLIKDLL
nr:subtilisin-like protease SBT1.4 [Ipomoea batatas]